MRTVAVIPTYNERENILSLVERCVALPLGLDLYFIDDSSPDGTGELLESLRSTYPCLRVLHRPGKLGLGSAYRQAFRHLLRESYDRYVALDADLSHRPESIPDLLRASNEADLVIGSRYCLGGATKNWSAGRRLLSRTANKVARGLLGLKVMDATAGFRCYRPELLIALDQCDIRSNGYAFQVEMTYYSALMGFRVREVPILFEERVQATSKMSQSEIALAMHSLYRLSLHRFSGHEDRRRIRSGPERVAVKDTGIKQ